MKIKLITLTVVLLLSACSKEIPSHRLVFNGEIAFEEGSNKPFTGVANEYKNSYLQSLSHFKNGVLTKEEKFYKNGQLKKLVIIDAAGIANTTLFTEGGKDVTNEPQKAYWENGVTQSTYQYSNGLKDGLWEKFDATGVSVERKHWNNGIPLEPIRYEKFKVRNDIIYLADSELPFSGMIQYTKKYEDYNDEVSTVKINHQVQDGQLLGVIEVYLNELLFVYSTVSGVMKPLDMTNFEEKNIYDYIYVAKGAKALSGIFKEFDFEGRKHSVCEVETFDTESRWSCQFFNENDQPILTDSYLYPLINNIYTSESYIDGEQREYYLSGKLNKIEHYKAGQKVGDWREYYPSGKLYRIKHYKAGQKVGDWKAYSMDGADISNGEQKAKKDGWSGYFSNGFKQAIWSNDDGSYKTYDNGTLNGEAHLNADSEFSDEKGIYVDGKKEGRWETRSGGFRNYKNDLLDGKYHQLWSHNGCIWKSGVYSEGKKNGEWIEWSFDAPRVNGCSTKTVIYENGVEKKSIQ